MYVNNTLMHIIAKKQNCLHNLHTLIFFNLMSLFTTQLIPNVNNIYLFHDTFCWFQCDNWESERAEAQLAALQHLCEFTNSKCLHEMYEHQGLKLSCSRTHLCFEQQMKQNMSYCWCSALCTSEIDVFAIFKVMRL